uniref:Uncharacterized protein n=1 Tax=Avena sativa TaxID=4498 RepID=A0ACD5YED4_AVESA
MWIFVERISNKYGSIYVSNLSPNSGYGRRINPYPADPLCLEPLSLPAASLRPPVLLPQASEARVLRSLAPKVVPAMDAAPELQRLLEQEKQRMMINELIGKVTSECWDKCVTGAPGSKFSSGETACLTNCAQRFLEVSELVGRKLGMQ